MKNFKLNLIRIDRFFAWVLLIAMVFYFVSGYGITKQIIDPALALNLHTKYLPLVILVAFVIHTSYAVRLALIRWKMWNWGSMIVWTLFYVSFVSFFVYTEAIYQPKVNTEINNNQNSTGGEKEDEIDENANNQNQTSSSADQTTFTILELAKYNGHDGQPAYVAVDGIVYDVSQVFQSGKHYSHLAGQELTNAFYNVHAKSYITKYPVVGQMK